VLGSDLVDVALADGADPRLSAGCRAVLPLLAKVSLDPDGVTAADFAPALAAGVTRAAILEALNVGYLFNIITRLADAFEFHVGPPAAFASAAKRLLGHGYK
jgi:alkylhydroperoxidase family enzyme